MTYRIPTVLVLLLLVAVAHAATAAAPPAPELNYQGRYQEDGAAVTGTRYFRFTILDAGASQQWQSSTVPITVSDGLYATKLSGFASDILDQAGLVLRVEVGSASDSLTTLSPDIALLPALQATTAFSVVPDAVGTTELVDGSVTSAKIADASIAMADLDSALQAEITAIGTPDADSVTSASVVDGSLVLADLDSSLQDQITAGGSPGADSVTSATVVDGSLALADLDSALQAEIAAIGTPDADSVTSASVVDGSIAEADLDSALQARLDDLESRLAKLEGTVTTADLAGTYRLSMFQTELRSSAQVSGSGGIVAVYTVPGTLVLNGDLSGTFSVTSETGSELALLDKFGIPEWDIDAIEQRWHPDFVHSNINRGSDSFAVTWSYSAPVLTIAGIGSFDVVAGGRLLIRANANQSDGTNVMILATRVP